MRLTLLSVLTALLRNIARTIFAVFLFIYISQADFDIIVHFCGKSMKFGMNVH